MRKKQSLLFVLVMLCVSLIFTERFYTPAQ